jgi:hypothetical protein
MQTSLENYMFKGKHGEGIIEMHVGHFFLLMMGKMLVGVVLKSFDAYLLL